MKQLLFLFLFLLPCLTWAQYPSNGNQKITLGEQSTADGLIYRGVAADTVRKPSIDTMAYMVLDTTTNIIWHYKKATSNAWLRVGGSITSGLTGVLPVANGGTNTTTLTANKVMVGNGTSGVLTPTNLHWDNTNSRLGIGATSPSSLLEIAGSAPILTMNRTSGSSNTIDFKTSGISVASIISNPGTGEQRYSIGPEVAWGGFHTFYTDANERMRINSSGELTIGYGATDNGAYKLQVNSQIFATNATIATSDIRFKENIKPLDKGLEIINKLKPVKFNFISTTENNFSEFDEIGFIAQDVEGALSTELFAKAVVKKLDEDKDDSALGLMTEKFIPILVKAIQEQQALIKALEQRIINLENK